MKKATKIIIIAFVLLVIIGLALVVLFEDLIFGQDMLFPTEPANEEYIDLEVKKNNNNIEIKWSLSKKCDYIELVSGVKNTIDGWGGSLIDDCTKSDNVYNCNAIIPTKNFKSDEIYQYQVSASQCEDVGIVYSEVVEISK